MKMREHVVTVLSKPDYEVFCRCSCGATFYSNASGLNCVMRQKSWVTTCPVDLHERHVRQAFFPFFFIEGPPEFETDDETKLRALRFLGIAK